MKCEKSLIEFGAPVSLPDDRIRGRKNFWILCFRSRNWQIIDSDEFLLFSIFICFAVCWLAVKVNDNFLSLFLQFKSSSSQFECLWGLLTRRVYRQFIVPGALKGKAALAIRNELLKAAGFFHRKCEMRSCPFFTAPPTSLWLWWSRVYRIFIFRAVNVSWIWFNDDF